MGTRPRALVCTLAIVMLAATTALACEAGTAHARPAAKPAPIRVPILMYHVVDTPPPGTPNLDLWVNPSEFQQQMTWLAAHGYHAVTLDRWWAAWHGGASLPPRPIVISMDDGFRGWYTQAAPILAQLGWPAVMNVAISHIGRLQRPPAAGPAQAQWQIQPYMIRALLAAGWELDSHSLTHPHLTQLSADQLAAEVDQSRTALQAFGGPVDFFCYPYGEYNPTVIAAVRAAGYEGASSVAGGTASSAGDPFRLPRIDASRGQGTAGLRASLRQLGLPVS
jgi:peptidoglycan/xylan/chitin deacetylase (PgdA/CDA1 family)